MKDYSGNIETATRLITKFGADGAILRRGADTGPAHNPTPGAKARTTVKAVDIGFKNVTRNGVITAMRTFLVDPAGLKPETPDQFAFGGDLYSVESVNIIAPSGVVVLSEIFVNYVGPDNG